jgi:hypothetical protein
MVRTGRVNARLDEGAGLDAFAQVHYAIGPGPPLNRPALTPRPLDEDLEAPADVLLGEFE